MARFIILMGVSGSGKTVIGKSLAPNLNAEFIDGDNLHTQRNVDKMAAGIPLTDEDRLDWLNLIAKVGHDHAEHGQLRQQQVNDQVVLERKNEKPRQAVGKNYQ